MRYDRDITTIEEILSTDEATLDLVLTATAHDFQAGDCFFIKEDPTTTYFIEDIIRNEEGYYLIYSGGKRIDYDDAQQLFSSGTILNMISLFRHINIQNSYGWVLVFDETETYTSEDDELYVTFLWRVLKDLCVRKLIQ